MLNKIVLIITVLMYFRKNEIDTAYYKSETSCVCIMYMKL